MGDNIIVELQNVGFSYGARKALEDVSFVVNHGEFVGVIGPNGSGKTTVFKIILGLLHPQQGSVRLFGTRPGSFREWYRIGYVSQEATSFNFGFPATVFEVVIAGTFGRRGLFKSVTERESKAAEEALRLVGLSYCKDRMVGKLSGGQQQRVFIARALVTQPELLILDEPTVGIDIEAQAQFYELLEYLRHEIGLTIMLASHDLGALLPRTTKVLCLNRHLVFCGGPDEFVSRGDLLPEYGFSLAYGCHKYPGSGTSSGQT